MLYRYKLKAREGLILQCGERFGEIAPLPGFSKETLPEAEREVKLWMDKGVPPKLPSVRWGIACAQRELDSVRVPLCALGTKAGFLTCKLKLGHLAVPDAVEWVKKQRGVLRLDCNRKWTLSQAVEFVSHFKPDDFAYIEEPTEDVESFSKQTGFPVALDESIGMNWSKIPTLRAIVVKPMIVGHFPHVPPHLDLVLSSSYESGLGLLHIARSAKGNLPVGLDTVFEDDLLVNPIRCESGIFSWEKSEPILNFAKLCRVH